jgi:hypothetical protein
VAIRVNAEIHFDSKVKARQCALVVVMEIEMKHVADSHISMFTLTQVL